MNRTLPDESLAFIAQAANEVRRKYPMVGLEDLQQEAALWVLSHPGKVKEFLADENEKRGEAMLYKSLRRELVRYAREEKAHQAGYRPQDEAFYTAAQLEDELLPALWDREAWSTGPIGQEGGGRSATLASERGNWMASLVDAGEAFARLNEGDQLVIEQLFRYGAKQRDVARYLGVTESTMSERIDKILRRMVEHLGGARPEGYPKRKAMSNAQAQAVTSKDYE